MSRYFQLSELPSYKTSWADQIGSTDFRQDMCDGQPWPKISIVTPSFNQGKYLEKAIISVLDQNYPNIEYIIIDGGSTDNSVEIINKYESHLKYWVSEPDRGQSNALNKGFARATGDLLSWLNSDDYLLPGALQTVASLSVSEPNAALFVGGGLFVDAQGREIDRKLPAQDLSFESLLTWLDDFHFIQPSCFFTPKAWQVCGPLDERIHMAMDLDLWLKFGRFFRFARTDALLSCARLHDSAKTTQFANMSLVDSCLVLIAHGGEAQARKHLELMAARLSWHEHYLRLLTASPFYRLFAGLARKVLRTDEKWREMTPTWAGPGDGDHR